ncbi:succinate dehydrogenase flavoprotein subunit [Ketogulonicigenium robustum]|uniref:Succinate dehydrogenase flavoprotein subunit n=1 Tax=Ketogulonicigenium robustum TaxID=92947 RepID=A0A1W6NW86_9RHOB|nr:hypothetical protein [Ketogulonicigenium robustum]ARO13496.1 succinate dehydrogenase flavoprotein subunit [Ketogulonicigenium robustum]
MRALAVLCGVVALSGCISESAVTDTSRALAKQAVDSAIAGRVPAALVTPVTDCVIDNATPSELASLAAGAFTGVASTQAGQTVMTIAGRQATQSCVVGNLGSGLIGSAAAMTALQGAWL